MPFRKRPFSFCHFLCRHIFYGYAEFPGGVDLSLHTAGYRIAENPQLVAPPYQLQAQLKPGFTLRGNIVIQKRGKDSVGGQGNAPHAEHEPAVANGALDMSLNVSP